MFILALTPIIWLVFALLVLRIETYKASIGACLFAFVEATLLWKFPLISTTTAMLEGFAMALWPIVIVIIAAVFTYNLTVHTKAMDHIKHMITSVSNDKRILIILIGWCFGGFLEGMAGFGVAIAIPASMLVALGFNPVKAILACLIANSCPTMFGSIGIPTVTLASITGLDASRLAFTQVIQAAPLLFASPFLMVLLISDGLKTLKGIVPVIVIAALSFIIPEMATAYFVGPELAAIVASVVSLILTFTYATHHDKGNNIPEEYKMEINNNGIESITLKEAIIAWSPFILIFIVLLLTSKMVPAINQPLSSIKTNIQIFQGTNASPYTFTWINTPGVLILISGIIGGLIQGCNFNDFIIVMKLTIKQMYKTIITMIGVLGCAKIMSHSGMISDISFFFVAILGSYYPLAAPLIGALGTFVTGSGTSSSVLFGTVQLEAAQTIGANEYWLVGANSLGVSAGKMLSPQSIAIGCAACGLKGKDGEIMSKIFKYAFGYLIVMSLIVYTGSLIL
jgi:lactate permease